MSTDLKKRTLKTHPPVKKKEVDEQSVTTSLETLGPRTASVGTSSTLTVPSKKVAQKPSAEIISESSMQKEQPLHSVGACATQKEPSASIEEPLPPSSLSQTKSDDISHNAKGVSKPAV